VTVFLNVKVFSYALIRSTYLRHYFQTEQVFKDFDELKKQQDDQDWERRGKGPEGEPLDEDADDSRSPGRAGLRSSASAKKPAQSSAGTSASTKKPAQSSAGSSASTKKPAQSSAEESRPTVVVVKPPATSEPGIIKPLAINPNSGEGRGLGTLEPDDDHEMPEIPQESFLSQEEAVEMVQAQESTAVKAAKRFTSESFRDLKESLLSSIAMCKKNNVSISFHVVIYYNFN
jgi:hypothetical protein